MNHIENGYSKFLMRFLIVVFWILAIIGFLYLPVITSYFKTTKSINVAVWADMVDPVVIKEFEKETGIKVNFSYIESNEELYTRFKATGGVGYDIIFASDNMIEFFIKDGFLKKINKTKIDFWHRLDKRLLGLFFDPHNTYSIPHSWYIYGLGVDKDYFEKTLPDESYSLVFDPNRVPARIGMPNIAREAILITALYLFGTIENLTQDQLDLVKDVMIAQKKHVEAYTEFRADYLLMSKISPVVVTSSVYLWRALQAYKDIVFVLPKEGTVVLVDNVAIPQATDKEEMVYRFINFLYRPEIIQKHFDYSEIFPATTDLFTLLKEDKTSQAAQAIIDAHKTSPETWQFFQNVVSEKDINNIWIALKAA